MEAPDFSPGERAFNPAENARTYELRALALVAASDAVCDFFRSLFRKVVSGGRATANRSVGRPAG